MFQRIFKAATEKLPVVDPITAEVSKAKQEHEIAVARLNTVLCETLDGKDCPCGKLTLSH